MSIYTLSRPNSLPRLQKLSGLTFKQFDDITTLSKLNNISGDEVRLRMANDHFAYVAYLDDNPAAFGWVATGKAMIGELSHRFVIPKQHRYLWNFRTLVPYRGLGIYPRLLQFIVQHERRVAKQFWIIHAPENKASLKGIVKAGFVYVGHLTVNNELKPEVALHNDQHNYVEALQFMGFVVSEARAASCWNCFSPYLKKRKIECCCISDEKICLNNKLAELV